MLNWRVTIYTDSRGLWLGVGVLTLPTGRQALRREVAKNREDFAYLPLRSIASQRLSG